MVGQGSLIHAPFASNGTFKQNRVGGSKAVGGGDYWRSGFGYAAYFDRASDTLPLFWRT